MSAESHIYKQNLENQRIYRIIAYFCGIIAFIILVTVMILKNIYLGSGTFIVSKIADNVIYDILTIIFGTVLGSAIIGTFFDLYQRRFVGREILMAKKLLEEGIFEVFRDYTDTQLLQYLTDLIDNAKAEMTFIGLDLRVIANNHRLLGAIGKTLNRQQNLRVNIIFAGDHNPGVNNRISEESQYHSDYNLTYDSTWINSYPDVIKSRLEKVTKSGAKERLKIDKASTCLMMTIIKIDDIYLFFSYGSPNIPGDQSPWIALDASHSKGCLKSFLEKSIDFYT